MKITVLGLDLAKKVFQLHGVDAQGHVVVRKKLVRPKLFACVAQLAPVALVWKPARVRTTELARCGNWDMLCASSAPSSCPHTGRAAKTTSTMLPPSARREVARKCALSPSKTSHTIPAKSCTGAEEKNQRHLAAAPAPCGPRGSAGVASGLPWLRPTSTTVAKIAFELLIRRTLVQPHSVSAPRRGARPPRAGHRGSRRSPAAHTPSGALSGSWCRKR